MRTTSSFDVVAAIVMLCGVSSVAAATGSPSTTPHDGVVFTRGSAAYIVASPRTELEKRVARRLSEYLERVLGRPTITVQSLDQIPLDSDAVVLAGRRINSPIPLPDLGKGEESFVLATGRSGDRVVAVAAGRTDRGLKRAVQHMIIASEQKPDSLVIPELHVSESPWILHREWTMCPWQPEFVRGEFHNPYADKRMNIYLYSQQRLSDYVEMFDSFGFSGCQLMETCYTYSSFGSMDAAADWQKRVMRLVRENGQDVSLWAWTAQFTAFGWTDPEVTYTPRSGLSAFDDPNVRRGFEKYYDHYAEFAPYIDRFFFHFYDPGHLSERPDVFKYMGLLEQKLKKGNPKIQMGIDFWAAGEDYLTALIDNGFKNYLLVEAILDNKPDDQRIAFHEKARKLGMQVGVWGWYITEYETDQLASMYVNSHFIKNTYQRMKNGSYKDHPGVYWSEMEAHHLNDIYSMYVAGQLLWNPDRDPHQILAELANGIWGPANGPKVLKALELVEDTRTGPTYETYWWTSPTHRIGTADPAEDLRRADEAISQLTAMKPDKSYVSKFPLPFPPETFVDLMLPHLKQIKLYAEFRLKVADIDKAAAQGAPKEKLEKMLADAWQPIPEFNTWIGTFGCQELREQKKTVQDLRGKYGLDVRDPGWLRNLETERVLQAMRERQRALKDPFVVDPLGACAEFWWPDPCKLDRFRNLIDDGIVEEVSKDKYRMVDWQNWARQ